MSSETETETGVGASAAYAKVVVVKVAAGLGCRLQESSLWGGGANGINYIDVEIDKYVHTYKACAVDA